MHGFASMAFPAISTGIYGFPKAMAAEIAVSSATQRTTVPSKMTEVIFCCFDEETFLIYDQLLMKS
jgi:O-acetyl-ADP-ribose deacetylase